jgi:hypothetical protein
LSSPEGFHGSGVADKTFEVRARTHPGPGLRELILADNALQLGAVARQVVESLVGKVEGETLAVFESRRTYVSRSVSMASSEDEFGFADERGTAGISAQGASEEEDLFRTFEDANAGVEDWRNDLVEETTGSEEAIQICIVLCGIWIDDVSSNAHEHFVRKGEQFEGSHGSRYRVVMVGFAVE